MTPPTPAQVRAAKTVAEQRDELAALLWEVVRAGNVNMRAVHRVASKDAKSWLDRVRVALENARG